MLILFNRKNSSSQHASNVVEPTWFVSVESCSVDIRNVDCSKNGQATYCKVCKSKYHNVEGHYKHFPSSKTPRKSDINMNEATSFVEGAISMDMKCTGTNFINALLLIDKGALIPSGVVISEQFFINNLGGGECKKVITVGFELSKWG